MPFERRNLRDAVKKRDREKFFSEFPEKAHKRFEHIAEKMKEISSPFSTTPVMNAKSSIFKKEEKEKKNPTATPKNTAAFDILASPEALSTVDIPPARPNFSEHTFSEYPKKTIQTFFIALIFLGVFWGVMGVQAKNFLGSFSQQELISQTVETVNKTFGAELKKDALGRTNILLLGSGGSEHDGGFLTDSIIVISLNHENNALSMLSIPRDLYVSYTVNRSKRKGKINALFRDGHNYWKYKTSETDAIFGNSANIISEKVEEIIHGDIHYTAFIDFDGFTEIVDELGGVTLDVEKKIYDTSYPAPNYKYQTFSLNAGLQTLDGSTALKYVRSRHGNAGGDFGRSHRQKKMIMALKEQAFAQGIFSDPEALNALFGILEEHFWTDLSPAEILSAVHFAKDIQKDQIVSVGITDNVEQGVGGFLYTPPRDDIEHRMSVFLPYLSGEAVPYAQVHYYWEGISLHPLLSNGNKKIEIFNSTKRSGLASKTAQNLLRYNIQYSRVDDLDETQEATRIEYINTPENQKLAEFLKRKLNMEFDALTPAQANSRYPKSEEEGIPEKSNPTSDTHDSSETTEKTEKTTLLSPLSDDTFRIIIGKDFNANAYQGTLIRTPPKTNE